MFYRVVYLSFICLQAFVATAALAQEQAPVTEVEWREFRSLCREGQLGSRSGLQVIEARQYLYVFCFTADGADTRQEVVQPCPLQNYILDHPNARYRCEEATSGALHDHIQPGSDQPIDGFEGGFIDLLSERTGIPTCGYTQRYGHRVLEFSLEENHQRFLEATLTETVEFYDWLNNGYPEGSFSPDTFQQGASLQEAQPLRFCVINGALTGQSETAETDQSFYLEMYRPDAVGAGPIDARIRDTQGQRFDIQLSPDSHFPFIFRSGRLDAETFAVRNETITVYGAALGLLDTIDILPPDEDFEITFEPNEGPLVAEQLYQIDLTIVDAEVAESFFIEMEGRHAAFPDGEAGTAELRLIAGLEDAGCAYSDEQLLCTVDDDGNAAFFIDVPDSASLHWTATSLSDETRMSEGDLEILPFGSGTGGTVEDEDELPEIRLVLLTQPQTGLDNLTDLASRYPFGSDVAVTQSDRWRYVVLIGENLPLSASEAELNGVGSDILYFFEESHESIGAAFDGSHLDQGLSRLAEAGETGADVMARLRAQDLDMLVVFAQMEQGVRPGPKRFQMNGQSVLWSLEFADTFAALGFARPDPNVDGRFEPVSESYGHETLFAELTLVPMEMPYDDIVATLDITDGETGDVVDTRDVILSPTAGGRWRSEPLMLDPAGDADAIRIESGDIDYSTLTLSLPLEFTAAEMPFAAITRGTLTILPQPPTSQWIEDVETAAQCSGYALTDDTPQGLARSPAAYDEGDPFENLIILNGEWVSQDVLVGHLAGLLTIRRTYLRASALEEQRLRDVLADPARLAGQIAAWRQAFDALGLSDPDSPLFKINIPAAPLNLTTNFGHILQYSTGYTEELSKTGMTDAQILDWFEAAGRVATTAMLNAVVQTRNEVRAMGECDALSLMRFAYNTERIAELAVPYMMRQTFQGQWEPDVEARRFVRSTAGLARAFRAQEDASRNDSDTVTLALFVLTLPLNIFSETGIIAAVTVYETADAALGGISAIQRHQLAREDLRLSLGMSVTIGDGRYELALRRDASDIGTLLQAGLGSAMLGFNGLRLTQALRAEDGLQALRQIGEGPHVEISPEGLDNLAALRDDLLQRRNVGGALGAEDTATLSRLLDGEFLDGALLNRRLADAPPRPVGPAPPRPERIGLTDAQLGAAAARGASPDGIPRVLPHTPDAPSLGVASVVDPLTQGALLRADSDLAAIAAALPDGDLGRLLATQTRGALRDPNLVVQVNRTMDDIGRGSFLNRLHHKYLVQVEPLFFAGSRAHGIDWDALAILAHEIAHMIQSRFQQGSGVIIGRAMREFDASLVMVSIQNAQVRVLGRGEQIGGGQALRFALDYALSTQIRAWLRNGMSPRFTDASRYFDGLFQLDLAEVLARSTAHFPGMSERAILEEFVAAHERAIAAYSGSVGALPNAAQLQVIDRWRNLFNDAHARLAALPP